MINFLLNTTKRIGTGVSTTIAFGAFCAFKTFGAFGTGVAVAVAATATATATAFR